MLNGNRLRAGLVAFLLAALAACSPAEPLPELQEPVAARTPQPGHTQRDVRAMMTMQVDGAVEFELEDTEVLLHVVEILGAGQPDALWFFSVSSRVPVALDEDRTILFSADLSPGIYEGPGTYELGEEAGVSVEGRSGLSSGAYLEVTRRLEVGGEVARFDRFGEPCALEMDADARSGSVECPSLLHASRDDASIALSWSWERLLAS